MSLTKKIKPIIDVVVDTNVIRAAPTNSFFASEKFKLQVAKLRERAEINIVVPSAVFEEVVVQKTTVLQTAHAALKSAKKNLNGFFSFSCEYEEDLNKLKGMLRDRIKSDMEQLKCAILPIDLGKPLWDTIVEAVYWRKGPFAKGDPSALKDAIICAVAVSHAKTASAHKVVFLTNDKEAADLELFDKGKLIVLPSLESLETLIEDLSQETAAQLVAVRNQAIKRVQSYSSTNMFYVVWELSRRFNELCGRDSSQLGLATSVVSASHILAYTPHEHVTRMYPPFSESHVSTELVSEAPDGTFTFESKFQRVYHKVIGELVTPSTTLTTLERSEFLFLVTWTAKHKDGQLTEENLSSVTMPESKTTQFQVNSPSLINPFGAVATSAAFSGGNIENFLAGTATIPLMGFGGNYYGGLTSPYSGNTNYTGMPSSSAQTGVFYPGSPADVFPRRENESPEAKR